MTEKIGFEVAYFAFKILVDQTMISDPNTL